MHGHLVRWRWLEGHGEWGFDNTGGKIEKNLVLDYEVDAQGQMFPVSVILELDSEGLSATFDFGGQFTAVGSGTRVDG